jgi:hypothetical protein
VSPVAKKEEEIKRLNVNLPVSLHNAFKAATAGRGENMTDIIVQSIKLYVEKYGARRR